jgi:hypothetical protein
VARTVQAKLRDYADVRDFGAVGDGVADDTVAIQAAIDYAVGSTTGRGTVILGEGRFRITATLTIATRAIALVGVESGRRTFGSTPASCSLEWDGGGVSDDLNGDPRTRVPRIRRHEQRLRNRLARAAVRLAEQHLRRPVLPRQRAAVHAPVIYSNGNFVGYSQFRGILAARQPRCSCTS